MNKKELEKKRRLKAEADVFYAKRDSDRELPPIQREKTGRV